METAGRFKDAEFREGGESVSKSQLDEMCSEQMQKQNFFFFCGCFYASVPHSFECVFTHFFLFW